ncbi:hypothetical protein L3Q82_016442 [Scortum barcoo]|uniref:Uncharacterized protein n=1 Tax=Scortum barcoo TaxID=214431 RepID=A0ACB8X8G6_9TELE|nr:hypothetical protein L3Q82_016442 [Scortum barcoo]
MKLFLSLLILLPCVGTVTAVAGCHSDKDKDDRPRRENCGAAGFSDIPAGLEPSTKVLLFPSNVFSSLSWSSFQIFEEIYEIDLTDNKVPEVTPSASPVLPTLSVLRLGTNRLTSLPDGSFSACPGLIELYLEKNAIDSLSDHTFSGLIKLEILELSSNRIKVLPELMLHPLPAIETLYLENNKVGEHTPHKALKDNWFRQKEEVPYLYLSANPWECSCSLGYLRRYLDEYEFNVYVRDGPIINNNVESVVCDSPRWHKSKPVTSLEESELCSPATEFGPTGDFYQPIITFPPDKTTTAATILATIKLTTPPMTITPTTATSPFPTTSAPPATPPAFVEELHTVYHRVVTWSWYQTITRFIEWSNYSRSVISEAPRILTVQPTLPTVRRSTESPIKPFPTTTSVPSTTTSTTPNFQTTTTTSVPSTTTSTTPNFQTTTTTTVPSWVIDEHGGQQRGKISAVVGAGVFCLWLFAGCLLLCVASAVCILVTLARLVIWYRRVYKPLCVMLTRRGRGSEGIRLLTYDRREEEMTGGGGGGGVMALYRSVLFINREGEEAMEGNDGGRDGEGGGEGGQERLLVTLEPTGGGGAMTREEGERKGREERGVYRKTLYRVLSKEEEIEGWRDVMEECQISAEDGGRRGGGGAEGMDRERRAGRVSSKRYSVILREEREEAGGGREELDWVVGGWEVKGGGGGGEDREEPRSSWGEWLAHHLPSLPWGVTTPPEGEAAQ